MPNKPLFGIRSGSPQSHMARSRLRTDVDILLYILFCFPGSRLIARFLGKSAKNMNKFVKYMLFQCYVIL